MFRGDIDASAPQSRNIFQSAPKNGPRSTTIDDGPSQGSSEDEEKGRVTQRYLAGLRAVSQADVRSSCCPTHS